MDNTEKKRKETKINPSFIFLFFVRFCVLSFLPPPFCFPSHLNWSSILRHFRMKSEKNYGTLLLLVLFDLASSAMVLPRPPSSPNHIHEDHEFNERKIYEGGKSVHGFFQNTNVERPDTDNNYRYVNSIEWNYRILSVLFFSSIRFLVLSFNFSFTFIFLKNAYLWNLLQHDATKDY